MESHIFESGFSQDKIVLEIAGTTLIVKHLPMSVRGCRKMFFLMDYNQNEYKKEIFDRETPFLYSLPSNTFQTLYLNIYVEEANNLFCGFIYGYNVPIKCNYRKCTFFLSQVFEENCFFFKYLKTGVQDLKKYLSSTECVQSTHPEIMQLAQDICKTTLNAFQKLTAIHDWVANNIYYDQDALKSGQYINADNSAIGTYYMKRSVCQGYSNLSVALCRAVGIPAVGMLCFALGGSTEGGWERQENMESDSNHVVTFAYVDNRWTIMDVTWDSDNVYEHQGYHKKVRKLTSRKYFDTTLAFISNTHRFTDEWIW